MFFDETSGRTYQLVSGLNCVAEVTFDEFMATKHRFNKAKGVFFKQYVQSFKQEYEEWLHQREENDDVA